MPRPERRAARGRSLRARDVGGPWKNEGMNFPLADLAGIADDLQSALSPALSDDAHRLLSLAELVEAMQVVEQLGRLVDAGRLLLAGEAGRRAEPEHGDDRITVQFGCGTASELL